MLDRRDAARECSLTLAQVRAARRFAWKDGYAFAEGRVLRLIPAPGQSDPCHLLVRATRLNENDKSLQAGWLHLHPCGCEFCGSRRASGSGCDAHRPR